MNEPARPEVTDQDAWLALNLARFTWPDLSKDLARHLAQADFRQALVQNGLDAVYTALPGSREKLATIQQSRSFADESERLQTLQVALLTFADADYPPLLRWIAEPPPVLYVRGSLQPAHEFAVAVVGSRKPSPYGRMAAQRFSADLVQQGYTVISGLARGIDRVAHESALRAGGQTLAVLGSGINVIYPPENRRLVEQICVNGAVMSEFPLDTKPDRWNFPRRNRIISGLALGTLVVEATIRSGSLHTARHALEQGREVFAIPGRIDAPGSQGTHQLIKQGAKLVETLDDVVEEFPEIVRRSAQRYRRPESDTLPAQVAADLSTQEARLLALIPSEETHIDAIIQTSQLPAHVVMSILVTLELRGLVRQFPGKLFVRNITIAAETLDERK
jgi:DNA processing protein